jgi:hypothetical protein
MFIHVVFFWLKPGTPDAARQQLLADCRDYLSKISTVRQLLAGRPAHTPRAVVDNSYDVALTIVLADRAAHDEYQEHALHKQFILRNSANWARVQVFDFVE